MGRAQALGKFSEFFEKSSNKSRVNFSDNHEALNFYKESIPLFAHHLHLHLKKEKTRLMLDEVNHPMLELGDSKHLPNQVSKIIFQRTYEFYKQGQLSIDELRLILQELTNFVDVCGACERIKIHLFLIVIQLLLRK